MSPEVAQLLGYLGPLLAALIVSLPGLLAWRQARHVGDKVVQVHMAIDGRLDQLLEEARNRAYNEGVVAGRKEQMDLVARVVEAKVQTVLPPPPVQGSEGGTS